MMPTPWFTEPMRMHSEDRGARELRAYLRTELRVDESWLRAEMRGRRKSPVHRIRRWLERSRRSTPSTSVAPEVIAASRLEPIPSHEGNPFHSSTAPLAGSCVAGSPGMACLHLAQEDLGGSTGVLYRLCLCCGAVLLVTAEGRWVIPPVDPRDGSPEPATVAPPFSTYP